MQRRTTIWLALVLPVIVLSASRPHVGLAYTAVWQDVANGQGRDCDGMLGSEFF